MCMDRHGEPIAARWRFHARARALLGLALVAAALLAASDSRAEDTARASRVVWTAGDRLYVASPDSGAIRSGMIVRVFDREREITRGQVTGVLDGVLASVRLTRGLIAADVRLERLQVLVDPAEPRAPGALRIGLPAPGRNGLVFSCANARLDLAALPRAYRAETLAVDAFRLLAADSGQSAPAWPETMFVRMFGDRADEEIALERGELDLAVFWPGEPSGRLRQGTSGYETLLGERTRGVLAALARPQDSLFAARLAPDMAALNAEMFGGDLLRWPGPEVGTDEPARDARGVRYVVDTALPGKRPIERFLDRRRSALARPDDRTIRLTYLDAPVGQRDSLKSAWQASGMLALFTLRTPEFCSPELAAVLRALGVDAFANLLRCGAGGSGP